MENEIWKSVLLPGYEWRYDVSSKAEIRDKFTGKIIRQGYNNCGYKQLGLKNSKDMKYHTVCVHRLVASAFHGLPEGYKTLQVDHINGVRDDNRPENLRWCTREENLHFPGTVKRRAEGIRKALSIPLVQLDRSYCFLREWASSVAAANGTGINQVEISLCANGTVPTAGGYRWMKKSEYHPGGVQLSLFD